jgi:hypothetical protein
MWHDPIVEELHKHGRELAAKFNYDVHAICQYYQERQKLENRPVVSRKPRLIKDSQTIHQKSTMHSALNE